MADTNANEDREKSRNTNYCCVPQCHNYLGEGVRRHYFPKDVGLKKTWEAALKMGKPASSGMKVCGAHFLPENYFPSGKLLKNDVECLIAVLVSYFSNNSLEIGGLSRRSRRCAAQAGSLH